MTKYSDKRPLNAKDTGEMKSCIFVTFGENMLFWQNTHNIYIIFCIIVLSSDLHDKELALNQFPSIFNTFGRLSLAPAESWTNS